MSEIELHHTPTENIKEGEYNHVIRCKCGNIIMACDEEIPWVLRKLAETTPCSKCVTPIEYAKRFLDETT